MESKFLLILVIVLLLTSCSNQNNISKLSDDKLSQKIQLLTDRVNGLETRIKDLQKQIDDLRKHPVYEVDPIETQNIAKKLGQKLDKTNSYVYQNTQLLNYQTVKVYYGTGKGDYQYSFEVPESYKKKGIIIFKNLKDNTKYYYEIYGDGLLISKSYFKTASKQAKVELENKPEIKNGKALLKFKTENVKKLLSLEYTAYSDLTGEKLKEEIANQPLPSKKIILNGRTQVLLTGLDANKSYGIIVEYLDISNQTGYFYFVGLK